MPPNAPISRTATAVLLLVIVLAVTLVDRTWLALDHAVPAWDQSYHLNNAATYRDMFARGVAPWSGDWWQEFWTHTTKNPPLTYALGGAAMGMGGRTGDAAAWAFLPANVVLLLSVFVIGRRLADARTGIWAAALTMAMPGLTILRQGFLIDLPLVAMVMAGFAALTIWHRARNRWERWGSAAAFGLFLGLGMLAKPTAALYLAVPALCALALGLRRAPLQSLGQTVLALCLAIPIAGPWYAANLIFIVSAGRVAAIDDAYATGDPLPDTLAGWLYYPQALPAQVTWPLIVLGLVALILNALGRHPAPPWREVAWLALFTGASYVVITLIPNKDPRFVTPYLPVIAVALAVLTHGTGWLMRTLRWGALGLAIAAHGAVIFLPPPGAALATALTGGWSAPPHGDDSAETALRAIVAQVHAAEPHRIAAIGLASSTAQAQEHAVTLYGREVEPRIYGRELSNRQPNLDQQIALLDWLLVNPNDPRIRTGAYGPLIAALSETGTFQQAGQWRLDTETPLILYRRTEPFWTIEPIARDTPMADLTLSFSLPQAASPASDVRLRLTLVGPGPALADTVVLLDWIDADSGDLGWRFDVAAADGALRTATAGLRATGTLGMTVGERPGRYRPRARLLSRGTGTITDIALPEGLEITLRPGASPQAAYPRARSSRFQHWAALLQGGPDGFGPLFDDVGTVNLASPGQDYIAVAEDAARARLTLSPGDAALSWDLLLAAVLRRDADAALAALDALIEADPGAALPHAYRAFVLANLFRPTQALEDIATARVNGAEIPELTYLELAAEIMRGRLLHAWNMRDALP